MTSATDKLRRLLDERGVEWKSITQDLRKTNPAQRDFRTVWESNNFLYEADEDMVIPKLHIRTYGFLTPEQAIAVTLGRGTLTAEDVRSFLNRNSVFDDTTWTHGRQELVFDEDDLQAMADELNATLGRGKCRIEHYGMGYYCSKCGNEVGSDDPEDEQCIDANAIELWSFCPRCGREVVDA